MVENLLANAGDAGDLGSVPGLGRSPGETWVQSLAWDDSLEKEMATHHSILAWEIPWTEEPGGPQSMGLQSWTQLSTCQRHISTACKTFLE